MFSSGRSVLLNCDLAVRGTVSTSHKPTTKLVPNVTLVMELEGFVSLSGVKDTLTDFSIFFN